MNSGSPKTLEMTVNSRILDSHGSGNGFRGARLGFRVGLKLCPSKL